MNQRLRMERKRLSVADEATEQAWRRWKAVPQEERRGNYDHPLFLRLVKLSREAEKLRKEKTCQK